MKNEIKGKSFSNSNKHSERKQTKERRKKMFMISTKLLTFNNLHTFCSFFPFPFNTYITICKKENFLKVITITGNGKKQKKIELMNIEHVVEMFARLI